MVFVTGNIWWKTKTLVSNPETLLLATGKMVSLIKKILSLAKIMVAGIGTMVCMTDTIFWTSGTTVTAVEKTVSVAPTMVG